MCMQKLFQARETRLSANDGRVETSFARIVTAFSKDVGAGKSNKMRRWLRLVKVAYLASWY